MQASDSIDIDRPKEAVWSVITDLDNAADWITGILDVEVLEKPSDGLVGLKWKEKREFCGKEATEVMWITEAVENSYYCTRAESHGSIYKSRLSLEEKDGTTTLTMCFNGEAQTFVAKVLSALTSPLVKGMIRKGLHKDLVDIKTQAESR